GSGTVCGSADFNQPGRSVNTDSRKRHRDRHVAGPCDTAGDKGDSSGRHVDSGVIPVAAFMIDEIVDGYAGIRAKIEDRLVGENYAERRVGSGFERIARKTVVVDLEDDISTIERHGYVRVHDDDG